MHQSYPKHTTILDLVQVCPGCWATVSFIQDPFRERDRRRELYQATKGLYTCSTSSGTTVASTIRSAPSGLQTRQ